MQTLLEKAKQHPRKNKPITDEDIDLALAWVSGQISMTQASHAMLGEGKRTASNAQSRLPRLIKEAYRRGKIKII